MNKLSNPKKSIGLVLPGTPSYSETFFNSKIQGLQESGFEVIVFASQRGERKKFYEVREPFPVDKKKWLKQGWLTIKATIFIFFKAFQPGFRLFKIEQRERGWKTALQLLYINAHILPYNLDWLHFGFATMGIYRENVANAMCAKCGVSFRGYDVSFYPLKHPGCYQKLWKKVDKVHSISQDLYDRALELGLSKGKPWMKIPPALNPDQFPFKNNAGQLNQPIRILSVGRLHWKKGFEYGLSALSLLKKDGIAFQYQVIGEGPDFERLKFAAYQLGIQDEVEFLGKLSHGDTIHQMLGSDVYLQPSVQEGFCNAVQEAQATGLLCLVSNAEGLRENVINNKTGFVIPKRNAKAIKAKTVEIMEMPLKERKDIVFYASRRVKENFSLTVQKEMFKTFYNDN